MNFRRGFHRVLFTSLMLGSAASFAADIPLIVPNYLAAQEFFQASATFCVSQRVQQVYSASEFGDQPIVIRGFIWRPSPNLGSAFQTIVPDLQINLSTTSRQPDQLSSVFADNIGLDEKVVFKGRLKLSSHFHDAAGGTKKFDMVVFLQHPFYYDPIQGNLLLDIWNFQGSKAAYTDAHGLDNDGGSRAIALDPNATSASFTDTGIDPIQLIYRRVHVKRLTPADESKGTDAARTSSGLVALQIQP